jgi:hypothetical protein
MDAVGTFAFFLIILGYALTACALIGMLLDARNLRKKVARLQCVINGISYYLKEKSSSKGKNDGQTHREQ